MIKVDGELVEFNGSYLDINSEIAVILFTYVEYMQSKDNFTKSDIQEDLLLYMKELQYLVGCISRGENLGDKLEEMLDYVFS